MIRCLLSSLRDRVASFLGGRLYPEDDELDRVKRALSESLRREHEVRRTLAQRNTDLREAKQQFIDLRDLIDLNENNDLARWFGGETK